MNIKWTDKIANEELWRITKQKPIKIQIKRRKWNWIGHTLRKEAGVIEKTALDWNPQGYRRRGRPKKTWRRTIEDEIRNTGRSWNEVKGDTWRSQRLEALYGCPVLHKEQKDLMTALKFGTPVTEVLSFACQVSNSWRPSVARYHYYRLPRNVSYS
jgi:hypothetical protein